MVHTCAGEKRRWAYHTDYNIAFATGQCSGEGSCCTHASWYGGRHRGQTIARVSLQGVYCWLRLSSKKVNMPYCMWMFLRQNLVNVTLAQLLSGTWLPQKQSEDQPQTCTNCLFWGQRNCSMHMFISEKTGNKMQPFHHNSPDYTRDSSCLDTFMCCCAYYMFVCVCICICTYISTRTCIRTYTHTHTHTAGALVQNSGTAAYHGCSTFTRAGRSPGCCLQAS